MAPSIEQDVVVLYPWEVFTAIKNGKPCIGAKLYTYESNTSSPKAAYHDPYLTVRQTNPILMNDQGQAVVWLDGFYRLVLTDAENVQLWSIDAYEFTSGTTVPAPGLVNGMNEATGIGPSDGSALISVPNLIPTGYRVEGVIVRIDTAFGASHGLQQIAIGDNILLDRWGVVALTAGQQTTQISFRGADRPIAATAYSVLLSALGGHFDSSGSLTCRSFWSSITGWT